MPACLLGHQTRQSESPPERRRLMKTDDWVEFYKICGKRQAIFQCLMTFDWYPMKSIGCSYSYLPIISTVALPRIAFFPDLASYPGFPQSTNDFSNRFRRTRLSVLFDSLPKTEERFEKSFVLWARPRQIERARNKYN